MKTVWKRLYVVVMAVALGVLAAPVAGEAGSLEERRLAQADSWSIRWVRVPKVVGLPQAQALKLLSDRKLKFRIYGQAHTQDQKLNFHIAHQVPKAGARVKPGTEVQTLVYRVAPGPTCGCPRWWVTSKTVRSICCTPAV